MKIENSADLWGVLRDEAKESDIRWQRIEDSVQSGIPDVYLVDPDRHSAWVELKFNEDPFRKGQLRFAFEFGDRVLVRCLRFRNGIFSVTDMHRIAVERLCMPGPQPVTKTTHHPAEALRLAMRPNL